jgi:hypothetical protein
MRRALLTTIAVATALALVPAANAKEVSSVSVCGASGCSSIPRDDLDKFMDGGLAADAPAHAARWYQIRYTISPAPGEDMKPFKFRNVYVPSANLIRERGEGGEYAWFTPDADFVAAVRPALAKVDAYPASSLRGLNAKLPDVTPAEVVLPPSEPATVADNSSAPWVWIVLGGIAALALLAAVLLLARRRMPPRAIET